MMYDIDSKGGKPGRPLRLLAAAALVLTLAVSTFGVRDAAAQGSFTTVERENSGARAKVRTGKYYVVVPSTFANDGGRVLEGGAAEVFLALGEVPGPGALDMRCTTSHGTAGADDYIVGNYPLPGVRGASFITPILVKHDQVVEPPETFGVRCVPSGGTEMAEWQAWEGRDTATFRILDTTKVVQFEAASYDMTEDTASHRPIRIVSPQANGKQSYGVDIEFTIEGTGVHGIDPAGDLSRGGSTALGGTQTVNLGTDQSINLGLTWASDTKCEAAETGIIRLALPSGASLEGAGFVLGPRAMARVTIHDDDPPDTPVVQAVMDGTTLRARWSLGACAHTGWEMEYKLSTATAWTSARKGGVQWDYDNDGDGSNNNSWRTSWQVENLTATATYNVRVKVHNPHGSSSWGTATASAPPAATPTASLTGLGITDGTRTLHLDAGPNGNGSWSADPSSAGSAYAVHVAPGIRSIRISPKWSTTTATSVSAKSYAPPSHRGRPWTLLTQTAVAVTKSNGVVTPATIPLNVDGGSAATRVEITARLTVSGINYDTTYTVYVYYNHNWRSANDYLESLTMGGGGG